MAPIWRMIQMICETCEGCGRVEVVNVVTVDGGTEWSRSAEELVDIECPNCDGTGETDD